MSQFTDLASRLLLLGVAGIACFSLRQITFPGQSIRSHVNGMPVRLTFAAPNGTSLGKQLPAVTRMFPGLPCSVQVSLDTSLQDSYGSDGTIVATTVHELGHCMEHLLPDQKSAVTHPQPLPEWSESEARSEAYADAWASLYLIRCGVNLAPINYPDANGAALSGKALQTARSCVPRPEEAVAYRDPLSVIQTLRMARGYHSNGLTSTSPLMRELARGEAAAMGINLAVMPPMGLNPRNALDQQWIKGLQAYHPPADQRALSVPQVSRREQILWAKARLDAGTTLEKK